MKDEYWKRKSLAEMNADEWEGPCDGCALCCMHKIEDADTGEIFYTDIACRLLDVTTCRCSNYANRAKQVAGHGKLAAGDVGKVQGWAGGGVNAALNFGRLEMSVDRLVNTNEPAGAFQIVEARSQIAVAHECGIFGGGGWRNVGLNHCRLLNL